MMFDINILINNAIASAVQDALAPIVERIESLEVGLTRPEGSTGIRFAEMTQPASTTLAGSLQAEAVGALAKRIDALYTLLGGVIDVSDEAVESAGAEAGVTVTDAFGRELVSLVSDKADDFIEALRNGDTTMLMKDGVTDAVSNVINDGSFNVRFAGY